MIYSKKSANTLALPINLKLVCRVSCLSSRGISHTGYNYMEEIWEPVLGYEGLYEVSNTAKVRSCRTYKDGVLRRKERAQVPGHFNYFTLMLHKGGIGKQKYIHRLVAQAFIPNPENKPCVNHIDSNPQNSHVSNLEWCTHRENMAHAAEHSRYKHGGHHLSKLNEKQVLKILAYDKSVKTAFIARKFKMSWYASYAIRKRINWKQVLLKN